ncbi:hypothetical protein ACLK17_24115 [Escherichia coli]
MDSLAERRFVAQTITFEEIAGKGKNELTLTRLPSKKRTLRRQDGQMSPCRCV